MNIINGIKGFLKNFFDTYSAAEPIRDLGDYRRVKKWIRQARVLYTLFSVIAILEIFFVTSVPSLFEIPIFLVYTIVPALLVLTNLGYATLIMYLPKIIKSVVSSGSTGYNIGEKFQTTHVRVTHEYGNSYSVSSHTENKGCLFAVIAGTVKFMIWAFFCVYIGPFITFRKLRESVKNVRCYKPD
ncbi:MAG: hypothetical protein IJX80_11185 [Clostridia bacterium]|nr:hypothetical protein [Clostridia bacterium]